jgi:hypothetical protein
MSLTVIPSSGEISFSNIQTVFGGNNPISLSEYYADASGNYTSNVSGIPSIGSQISLSNFYGKSKVINYLVPGNVIGYMNENGGNRLTAFTEEDDRSAPIGNNNFSFFFYGTDYNNNMFWSTNQVLHFGPNLTPPILWLANSGKAILLGNADRRCNFITSIPTVSVNNHYIYKIIISQDNNFQVNSNDIEMVIRIIRGPDAQYIEVRIVKWSGTVTITGVWDITDGSSYKNTFQNYVPSQGNNFVLKSDLLGNNWQLFNNYYINL